MDTSIFNDRESKIAMCERVIARQLAFRVGLFAVSCITTGLSIFTNQFRNMEGFFGTALPWVGMGLMIATSYSFFDYRKLKKKIEGLKNPIQ